MLCCIWNFELIIIEYLSGYISDVKTSFRIKALHNFTGCYWALSFSTQVSQMVTDSIFGRSSVGLGYCQLMIMIFNRFDNTNAVILYWTLTLQGLPCHHGMRNSRSCWTCFEQPLLITNTGYWNYKILEFCHLSNSYTYKLVMAKDDKFLIQKYRLDLKIIFQNIERKYRSSKNMSY